MSRTLEDLLRAKEARRLRPLWRVGGAAETERIWRCYCAGPHFVSVRHDSDVHDDLVTLEIETYSSPTFGFWGRVRAAWNILWHGQHEWADLLLTKAQAQQIARELTR